MKINPLVSIVTPSLNQGRFIEETILSVKNQTYPNIKHIVVDGGSTDGTLDILRKYEDFISWVSEPDQGQSDAINKGWRRAKGEILGWLNSDDTYMPWAVQTAVDFFSENPEVSMVYGDCNIIDQHGSVIGQHAATEFDLGGMLCYRCGVPQPAAFFRRRVLDEVGYLDESLHMAMDYDLWVRIGLKLKVRHISHVLANFRMYPGTKSVDEEYRFAQDRLRTLNKAFSYPQLPDQIKLLRREAYSDVHLRIGLAHCAQRQMKRARKHLLRSVILCPEQLRTPQFVRALVTSFLGNRMTQIVVDWKARLK